MSEGQIFFLILCLLYLSECIVWVGRRTVLFSSRWRNSWRAVLVGEFFGNAEGSLTFLNPLPFQGLNLLGHWRPVSISPTGICAFTFQAFQGNIRPSQTGIALPYEAITEVKVNGKDLLLNGSKFAKCCSTEQAKSISKLVKRIVSEPIGKRGELIRNSLFTQFAKDDALNRFEYMCDLVSGTRWISSIFFVFLFVATPLIVSVYGLTRCVIPVAIFMFLSALFISAMYFGAHRALYPSQLYERVSNSVKMILCPPAAIRAVDLLTLNAMSLFHPVLLANLFLGSESLTFTRSVINDLKYPLQHDLIEPLALSIVSWHTACELDVCREFLEAQDSITMDELLAAPVWDGVSSVYCPRCTCQFADWLRECPDCPGVKLLRFSVQKMSKANHG
jgi:hypothetical protein